MHDLSYDNSTGNCQPPAKAPNNVNAFAPLTSNPNADIDLLWNYQLPPDDEYALIFET
jgi:hypothetical protein